MVLTAQEFGQRVKVIIKNCSTSGIPRESIYMDGKLVESLQVEFKVLNESTQNGLQSNEE